MYTTLFEFVFFFHLTIIHYFVLVLHLSKYIVVCVYDKILKSLRIVNTFV